MAIWTFCTWWQECATEFPSWQALKEAERPQIMYNMQGTPLPKPKQNARIAYQMVKQAEIIDG